MKDLMNNVHPVRAISPVSVADNTAQAGQLIDRSGYESLTFLIATGSLGDAGAEFTILVEEGDESDGSDLAAAADDVLIGTEALAGFIQSDDDKCFKIGYSGNKRYVKITVTPANNATASLICVIALLGHPHATPTANPPA